MQFAPEYPRTDEGWVIFPNDQEQRKTIFVPEALPHPAKANLWMLRSIIEYVSESGDTIMDIMAGTGSIMIAAGMDRRVICIELEDGYYNLMLQSLNLIAESLPYTKDIVTIIHGDCRLVLPIPANHIIFSPPYAGAMDIRRVRKKREGAPDDFLVQQDKRMLEYSKHPRNLSKLNTFLYNQEMEKVYRLCYNSLPVGGTLTIIIKDRIDKGKRVYLSNWVNKVCLQVGFEMDSWFKRESPGHAFTNIARSRGEPTVDDEDLIIFRKPS